MSFGGIMEEIIEAIADDAGRAHSLLETIDEGCLSESITTDDIRVLSQYALAYLDNVFAGLDLFDNKRK